MEGEATTVRVREARLPADAEELARVYVSSAEYHAGLDPHLYRTPDPRAVADRFRAQAGSSRGVLLVAEVAGNVVGLASVVRKPAAGDASMLADVPTASVDVAVLPDHRGTGIGTQLMREAERRASALGAERVQLDAHAANERALRFYRELGFRATGVLMTKSAPADPGQPSG